MSGTAPIVALALALAGCGLDTDARIGRTPDGGADAAPDAACGPALTAEPDRVEFGRIPVGRSGARTLTLRNAGCAPLHVTALTLDGSGDFVPVVRGVDALRRPDILSDPDGDGLPGLTPGHRFEVEIRFRPTSEPAADAILTVRTDDPANPATSVALTGNAGVPCLAADPSPVEFTGTLVGRADTRELRLVNCGDEAVEIARVRLSADTAAEFALGAVPPLPFILPAAVPGGAPPAVPLGIVYTPTAPGPSAGTLVIEPVAPKPPPLVVRLVGLGVENACPQARPADDAVDARVGDVVALDGSPSLDPDGPDRRPVSWRWTVVDRPPGSTAEVVESPGAPADAPGTPGAVLVPDRPGTWRLQLVVADELGLDSDTCGTSARILVTAR